MNSIIRRRQRRNKAISVALIIMMITGMFAYMMSPFSPFMLVSSVRGDLDPAFPAMGSAESENFTGTNGTAPTGAFYTFDGNGTITGDYYAGVPAPAPVADFLYAAGATTQKVYQYSPTTLLKTMESASYGGTIYALAQDDLYVYAAGGTTNKVYQLWKLNLTKKAESADYGGTIFALASDGTYVYAAGATTQKVYQYYPSNMTKKAESAGYGGTIYALAQDATYLYAGGATTQKIYQIYKSNLTKHAESADYGGIIESLSIQGTTLYAGGMTTNATSMYYTPDMSCLGTTTPYGTPGVAASNVTYLVDIPTTYGASGSRSWENASTSPSISDYEYFSGTLRGGTGASGSTWLAQTFTVGTVAANVDQYLTGVRLYVKRSGTISSWSVSLRATSGGVPYGPDLGVKSFTSGPSTSYAWVWCNFSAPVLVEASTKYAIVLGASGSGDVYWGYPLSSTYAGGWSYGSSDSGVTWTSSWTTQDFFFYTYGWSVGAMWDIAVNKTTGVSDTLYFGADGTTCYRPFFAFNTSTIPAGATINAATLFVYGNVERVGGAGVLHPVIYYDASYPHLPVVAGDFDKSHYSSSLTGPDHDFDTLTYPHRWATWSGLSSIINTTGWTRFIMRETQDVSHTPNNAEGDYGSFNYSTAYLNISYTVWVNATPAVSGGIYAVASSPTSFSCGGDTMDAVYQYFWSNATEKAQASYDGEVYALVHSGGSVYAAGENGTISRLDETDLSLICGSSSYGGFIFSLCIGSTTYPSPDPGQSLNLSGNSTTYSNFTWTNVSTHYGFSFRYFLDWNSTAMCVTAYDSAGIPLISFTFENVRNASRYYPGYDFNNDTYVDDRDMVSFYDYLGLSGAPGWISADVNKDGTVDALDWNEFVAHFDEYANNYLRVSYTIVYSYCENESGNLTLVWNNVSSIISDYGLARTLADGVRGPDDWGLLTCEFNWGTHRFHASVCPLPGQDVMETDYDYNATAADFACLNFTADDSQDTDVYHPLCRFWMDDLVLMFTPPTPVITSILPTANLTGVSFNAGYTVPIEAGIGTNISSYFYNTYKTSFGLYNTHHTTKTYRFYADLRSPRFHVSGSNAGYVMNGRGSDITRRQETLDGAAFPLINTKTFTSAGRQVYRIDKATLVFNTSALPEGCTILSSSLNAYLSSATLTDGDTKPERGFHQDLIVTQDPTNTYPMVTGIDTPLRERVFCWYQYVANSTYHLMYPNLVGTTPLTTDNIGAMWWDDPNTALPGLKTVDLDLNLTEIPTDGWTKFMLESSDVQAHEQPRSDRYFWAVFRGVPYLDVTIDYVSSTGWEMDGTDEGSGNWTAQTNFSDLYYETSYYWYVDISTLDGVYVWHYPQNGTGTILWNGHKCWKFTTGPQTVPVVTLVSPLDNATNVSYFHDPYQDSEDDTWMYRWLTEVTVNFTGAADHGYLQFLWYNTSFGSHEYWEQVYNHEMPVFNTTSDLPFEWQALGAHVVNHRVQFPAGVSPPLSCQRVYDGTYVLVEPGGQVTMNLTHAYGNIGVDVPSRRNISWCVIARDGAEGDIRTAVQQYPTTGDGTWLRDDTSPYAYYCAWNFVLDDTGLTVTPTPASGGIWYADNSTLDFTIHFPMYPTRTFRSRVYLLDISTPTDPWVRIDIGNYTYDNHTIGISAVDLLSEDYQVIMGHSYYWCVSLRIGPSNWHYFPETGALHGPPDDEHHAWNFTVNSSNTPPTITWLFPLEQTTGDAWRATHYMQFRVNDTAMIDSIIVMMVSTSSGTGLVREPWSEKLLFKRQGWRTDEVLNNVSTFDETMMAFTDRTFTIDLENYVPFYGAYNVFINVVQSGYVFGSSQVMTIGTDSAKKYTLSFKGFDPANNEMDALDVIGNYLLFDWTVRGVKTETIQEPHVFITSVDSVSAINAEGNIVGYGYSGAVIPNPAVNLPYPPTIRNGVGSGWMNYKAVSISTNVLLSRNEYSLYIGYPETAGADLHPLFTPSNCDIQMLYDRAVVTEWTVYCLRIANLDTSGWNGLQDLLWFWQPTYTYVYLIVDQSDVRSFELPDFYDTWSVSSSYKYYGVKVSFGTNDPSLENIVAGYGSDWGINLATSIEEATGIGGWQIIGALLCILGFGIIPVLVVKTVPPFPIEMLFVSIGMVMAFTMGFLPLWIFYVILIIGFMLLVYKLWGWAKSHGFNMPQVFTKTPFKGRDIPFPSEVPEDKRLLTEKEKAGGYRNVPSYSGISKEWSKIGKEKGWK